MNHLLEKFRRDIYGLIWVAASLFVGLSLYSFNPYDPSFNSMGNNMVAKNFCGYFGSFLSDILFQGFGVVAWMAVVACLYRAYNSFFGHTIKASRLRIAWTALLILTMASLVDLYFPKTMFYSNQILAGGLVGHLLSASLMKVFNFVGVAIILWTVFLVLLVFFTERSLSTLFKYPIAGAASGTRWVGDRDWSSIGQNFLGFFAKIRSSLKPSQPAYAVTQPQIKRDEGRNLFVLKDRKASDQEERVFLPIDEDEEMGESFNEKGQGEFPSSITGFFSKPGNHQKKAKKVKKRRPVRVENWQMPDLKLLSDPPDTGFQLDEREIKAKSKLLSEKLAQFSVRGEVVGIKPGPAVTMFEFKPAADVKISKITELADDLSLALSSESVRIIAPIPGRDVVGIETSNASRDTVFLKDILEHDPFWSDEIKLPIAMGRQADGEPKIVDLRKMPHLLVAGTTGSGKSVFVVSALTALLFRHSPKTLKLILVDPKQVDLAAFNDLPHLIMPPIRDPKKAVGALRWAIKEMEKRYRSMSKFRARGIEEFNAKVEKLDKEDFEKHETFNEELEGVGVLDSYYYTPQPYLCIVVEEFGDLMAVDKANVEQAVVRLAQMARACGIHLLLAMQSPRKDVVTGLIKTNIPGRISFKVSSKMDSRIILDEAGGERLLARGDMLFLAPGVSKPQRHHGAYLDEDEISGVVDFWKDQGEAEYDPLAMRAIEGNGGGYDFDGGGDDFEEEEKDERYDEILAYVSGMKEVSASLLQRKFRLGYPRAARMIEIFESEGVVGPANGSKPRQVLVRDLSEL